MRIRVNTTIRGAEITANPGQEVECPDALAAQLIENGAAVAVLSDVAAPSIVESATIEAPESAILQRPTPRRSRRAEE